MRNQILVALLGIAAMFTGCSQEDGTLAPSENKTASFTVAVDDGVVTRTEPSDKPTRYIIEVYEGTTATGTFTRVEQAANTFDVVLKDNQDYAVLFWADYGTANGSGNEYDATSLKTVKVATGKTATKVAFAGAVKFKVGQGNIPTDVVLKHAVAQVNFKQTGTELTANPTKLTVKYTESYSMNVEDYATTKIDGAVTHELTCNAVKTGLIATEYIFAGNADGATLMTIEATLDTEAMKQIPNAPFRRNYVTNISGAYSNKYDATMMVTCDNEWESPDNEVEVVPPTNGFKVGDYYPAGATKETALGVVFKITDNGTHGKIMSMDQQAGTIWSVAQAWASDKKDGNLVWACPNIEDMQHLWCIFNGEDPITWVSAVSSPFSVNEEAQGEFNKTMTTDLGGYWYWTSEDKSEFKDTAWFVGFDDGKTTVMSKDETMFMAVRAVASF